MYHEAKKQYAVEFKGLLDILGIVKVLYEIFGNLEAMQKYMFYADVVVDNFSVYEDGTIDFRTEVGIGLPQLKIGPFLSDVAPVSSKQTGGVEARLKIDTFADLYSLFFGLSLPSLKKFTTSGGTEYTRDGALQANVGMFFVRLPVGFLIFPDTIAAEYKDNVGFIKIPGIPAAINQLGGGIYNLHTIRDAIKHGTYPDFNADFTFGIVDTISPVIKGKRMLSIQDATISLGTTELKLSGKLYFYIVKLLTAEAGLMFYPITGAYVRGEVSLLDIIIIESYASARYDHQTKTPYIGGYGMGTLQVPTWSPIAPGKKLGEAKAEINTQFVEAYAKWGPFKVGARYYWREGKIKLASVPQDNGLFVIEQTNEDGITEVIEFGTNFRPIEVKPSKETLPPGGLVILDWTEPQEEYEFSSTGKGGLLIQARYDYDVEDFELTILDPYGNEYPIIYNGEGANVDTSVYMPENGSEKDKKNYIAVFIPAEDNKAGTWKIESSPAAQFEAYEVKEPAEIESVNVEKVDDFDYNVNFTISGFDKDSTYLADVFLVGEGQDSRDDSSGQEKLIEQFGDLMIKLAQDVEVNSANVTVPVELPDGIPNGNYRMIVALKEEYKQGNEVISLYTQAESDSFSVKNNKLPSPPQNVTAQSIGNSAIRVSWDAVNEDNITGYFVAVASHDGQEQERHFVPAQEELQSYSVDIRVKGLDEETTGKDILVAVCALRETGAPGSGDDGDDDSDDYLAEDAEVFPLGHGRYLVKWKAIAGISDYIITLSGEMETESFLYHDNSQGQQSELEATFSTLYTDSYYDVNVRGYLPKDVYAKNVEVNNIGDGSSKSIGWDKVDGNIASYTICAEPVTGSSSGGDDEPVTLVYQHIDVPTPQPDRYEIMLEDFVPGVDYKVTVVANEVQQQPSRYLGDMSEYVAVTVPVPSPPNVDVIIQPTDTSGSGTVRIDFDEDGNPYFRSNVQDITLDFISDTAVHSEVRFNPSTYALEEVIEKEGAYWSMPFILNEGLNEINIRSRNQQGDIWEENVMIYVKTSLPGLLLDDIRCEDGKVKVSGFTDRPGDNLGSPEPAVKVYINGEETGVDEYGRFSYEFDAPDSALIDVDLRLVDSFGNENIYTEKVINDSISRIDGIAIDISDRMSIGEIVRLKAIAYQLDGQGNRVGEFELPDELVRWEIIEGRDKAEITGNWLEAFAKGQIVLSAAYNISDDYTWNDYIVVDILVPEGGQILQEEAYLTGIETSFGELSPAFDRHVYQYNVTVPYNLGTMWLKPVTDLEDAIITVNGVQLAAGEKTGQIPLSTGNNTITITVSSPGKLTAVYTVNVFREVEGRKPTPVESEPEEDGYISGEQGGWYSVYGITIKIPPRAFDEDFKITVKKLHSLAGIPIPYGMRLVGNIFDISKDKKGSFKKPVTIVFPLELSEVDFEKEGIALYWLDEEKMQWVRLENTVVDKENGKVSGETFHFTKFAVLAGPKESQPDLPASGLIDISGHWAEEAIRYLVNAGIITGYPDSTFRPDRNISRAEFVTLLVKTLGLTGDTQKVFDDTRQHWARESIAVAYANGIVEGHSEHRFGPDDTATREQMAAMLSRALKLGQSQESLDFADTSDISAWALPYVAAAVKEGIFQGYADNTFRPKRNATRAETATVFYRILEK